MEFIKMHEIIESLDRIITTLPSPSMSPSSGCVHGPEPLPSSPPGMPPYNLRSLVNKPWKSKAIGGLESNPIPIGPRNLRGRK